MTVNGIQLQIMTSVIDGHRVVTDTYQTISVKNIVIQRVTLLTKIVTNMGRYQQMPPLLILLLVNIPSIKTDIDTGRPRGI
jgi:hypothetical protein